MSTPDDLATGIAAHVLSTDPHGGRSGHCAECYEPWPCLVRRLADAHARCTNLSNAEAHRIFEEAREQRERAERAEAQLATLREIADLVLWGLDRDSATMHVALADLKRAMHGEGLAG